MGKWFTYIDAHQKVGKTVKSLIAFYRMSGRSFSDIPQGTTGKVIAIDGTDRDGYTVAIQWDLPRPTPIQSFTRAEYTRFLKEV